MKGNTEYILALEHKIEHLLAEDTGLVGFYHYLTDVSLTTAYDYLKKIKNFVRYVNKPIEQLNLDDFTGYMSYIRRSQSGELTTSSYRITVYSALKRYCTYLRVKNIITDDYMSYIKRPKAKESQTTIQKRKEGYLTQEEIIKYLNAIEGGNEQWRDRDIAIAMVFLTTGIRCSALHKLDVDSVDFETGKLIVTDKEEKVYECMLNDVTLEALRCWLQKRKELLNGEELDALFVSKIHTRIGYQCLVKIIEKYGQKGLNRNISPHKLRATYGTQLYNSTKDILFVQKCMHHSNPVTTQLYIRGQENQTQQASKIMENLLK